MAKKIRQNISKTLDIPIEVAGGLRLIYREGDGLAICGGRGIGYYDQKALVVGTESGEVKVAGEALRISISEEGELLVKGQVTSILLPEASL